MDDRDELPACRQPKKSPWQQFCEVFSQNPFGQMLINHVSDIIKHYVLTVLSCCCGYTWFSPEVKRLKRKYKKCKEENWKLKAELEKLSKTKPDDSRATSIPCQPPFSVSTDQTQEIISPQRRNSARGCNSIVDSVEKNDIENQGEIEAEVRINIPDSVNSAEVKCIAEKSKILGPSPVSIKGSRILEDKVTVGDDILDELTGLADSCTKVDNRVTVQLGDCRIFIRTDEGVEQLELDTDRDELPMILHSFYAAGKLSIGGLNLKDATLKAATFDKSITLENFEHKQVKIEWGGELGVCTWFGQLPYNNCDKVYVCATKTITIQGHEVLVTSSVVKIEDNTLRTVVRFGIPAIILMIYIVSQLYQDVKKLMKSSNLGPALAWIVPLSFVILLPILPPSTENMIRESLERIRLIFLVLFSSTWNFLFKQHPDFENANNFRRRKYEQESLDGGSKESDDDAIDNSVAGNPSQNATNLMLVSLTESIAQIGKTLIELKNYCLEEDSDEEPDATGDDGSKDDGSKDDGSSDINEGDDTDWEWQAYHEHKLRSGGTRLRKYDDSQKESTPMKMKPFEVIYGLKEKLWSERDYIRIFSPSLIDIIILLIPRIMYARSEESSIRVYASELFHIREKLSVIRLKGVNQVFPEKLQLSEEAREKLQIHVGHLLRFMDKELENVLKRYLTMERGRHVSWDMLWAFFPVGTKVVYQCAITDEKLLGTVIGVAYKSGQHGEFLNVDIEMWDYNCSTWKAYQISQSISQFDGDCIFSSLQTYPLRFSNDPEKDEKEFLRRGEVFCELSMLVRNRFMNYNGLIYMQKSVNGCVMLVKEAASGRVMVDLGSFAKMNPNYKMGSAEPPCQVLRDNIVVPKDITTSPERMYSPAMVYGFSFRLKKWGIFQVCSFSEIAFNDSAFDALVMPKRRKVLLEKLVREYMPKGNIATPRAGIDYVVRDEASSQQIDPIVSKGEGCTILCYGPPGTGKTLTAESIAEKLHAPLWSLSVSELGTTPDALESYLVRVLDVATTWSAILLLDEADVYLEKRSCFDLTRTAMTGIFLRNLEYYRGVLFLTTNRIVTFDEAFRSRINMILYYEINRDDRRKIWSTILSRINMKNITDDQLDRFSEHDLNGRDIRNVVHRATILSKNNSGGRLTLDGIQQSLEDLVESLEVYSEKRGSQASEERTRSE